MDFGFVKSGVFSQNVVIADIKENVKSIKNGISLANERGVEVLCFPYLSVTGATCGDLFFTKSLQDGVISGVKEIVHFTRGIKMLVAINFPFNLGGKLYVTTAVISDGKVLGLVPKSVFTYKSGIDEKRYFTAYDGENIEVDFLGEKTLFGIDILFKSLANKSLVLGVQNGDEIYSPFSMAKDYSLSGATIILNPNLNQSIVGSFDKIESDLCSLSRTLKVGVLSAFVSSGESTGEVVFGGISEIFENGKPLIKSNLFEDGLFECEIDTEKLLFKRELISSRSNYNFEVVEFLTNSNAKISRVYSKTPFILDDEKAMDNRAEFILQMQAEGLRKRLVSSYSKTLVIGLSGGLDSTLALLVCERAIKLANKSPKDVIAVTMPCFGTTSRTLENSILLAKTLGVKLKKVDISKSVTRHLKDISHDPLIKDVAFENAQARERTQVLMDIANMCGGLVVGTGDLSEVALGWSTYNGDHMSMYGVNCTIPKTLVRKVVDYVANKSRGKLKSVLKDILDTPVSPELLPPEDGKIAQKTEDIVGPYILHDYFLYGMIKHGFSPKKLYELAKLSFKDEFDDQTILKWLKTFIRRFYTQQFKRSCSPDGVKVGSVALSPRSEYFAPSDASYQLYISELENL